MSLYELNKTLKIARQNCFLFIQIRKITIKLFSLLRYINISSYIKFQIPICHRQFFRKVSQNREYINNFCNVMENLFHISCQKWFNQFRLKLYISFLFQFYLYFNINI